MFQKYAFRFKSSPEKHVSKLLQSVLVCSLLIPPSSHYAAGGQSLCHYTIFTVIICFKCKTQWCSFGIRILFIYFRPKVNNIVLL